MNQPRQFSHVQAAEENKTFSYCQTAMDFNAIKKRLAEANKEYYIEDVLRAHTHSHTQGPKCPIKYFGSDNISENKSRMLYKMQCCLSRN